MIALILPLLIAALSLCLSALLTEQRGIDVRLYVETSADTFTLVGALRNVDLTINGESIDASHAGSGGWRKKLGALKDWSVDAGSVLLMDLGTPITVTATANAVSTDTSIDVAPLDDAIPSGTVLAFSGGTSATLSANAAVGATSIAVNALAGDVDAGETATYDPDPGGFDPAFQYVKGLMQSNTPGSNECGLEIEWPDTSTDAGEAIATEVSISAPYDGVAEGSLSFEGNGALNYTAAA